MKSFLSNVEKCNSFLCDPKSSRSSVVPFKIEGFIVGYVREEFISALKEKPQVFRFQETWIEFASDLDNEEKRSRQLMSVLEEWRKNDRFICLRGWRNETYRVSKVFGSPVLLRVERAAVGIFGFVSYGCHLNGYLIDPVSKKYKFWIARRSLKKDTWPGMLDNFAAGGLPDGLSPLENIIKECEEEASVDPEITKNSIACGAISYFLEIERGLYPEIEFVFDLELPLDYKPKINDGEVENFYLLTTEEVKEKILNNEFKPNCAVVLLDFFIRKGLLGPQDDPNYMKILTGMRVDLYSQTLKHLVI